MRKIRKKKKKEKFVKTGAQTAAAHQPRSQIALIACCLGLLPAAPGRPRLDDELLIRQIEEIAQSAGKADSRRRSTVVWLPQTLDHLTKALQDKGFHVK